MEKLNIKRLISVISVSIFSVMVFAQNLVPNGNFESYSVCPNDVSLVDGYVESWYNPELENGTSDYFNACSNVYNVPQIGVPSNHSGITIPHSGQAYCGLYAGGFVSQTEFWDYREYLSVQLSTPLIAGQTYVQFYAHCTTLETKGVSAVLSAYLSVQDPELMWDPINDISISDAVPQINSPGTVNTTNGWELVSGYYTATGGEKYITIGNFTIDSPILGFGNGETPDPDLEKQSYYLIDDVSVISTCPNSISYTSNSFCTSSQSETATIVGNQGGTFTSTAGLQINTSTGSINPATSIPGTYIITYVENACNAQTSVTIVSENSANLSFPESPFCVGTGFGLANLTTSSAGTFSSTSGLVINLVNGNIDLTNSNPGSYQVNYTIPESGICPAYTATATVELLSSNLTISSDVTINSGETTQLTVSGGSNYNWDPASNLSCSNCPNPIASPTQTTTYCATSSGGCAATECVTVTVIPKGNPLPGIPCDELYIPNAFSPNQNNMDDEICLYNTSCFSEIEFMIFNQWGEVVYKSTDSKGCWNGMFRGEYLPTGVYAYTFKGLNQIHEEVTQKGSIQILK